MSCHKSSKKNAHNIPPIKEDIYKTILSRPYTFGHSNLCQKCIYRKAKSTQRKCCTKENILFELYELIEIPRGTFKKLCNPFLHKNIINVDLRT